MQEINDVVGGAVVEGGWLVDDGLVVDGLVVDGLVVDGLADGGNVWVRGSSLIVYVTGVRLLKRGQAGPIVVVDAVTEHPDTTEELAVVQEDEALSQLTKTSVTVVVEHAPVWVAVFAVFKISHPRIVAHVERTFVVVVTAPETPKEVVVEQIDAVSVSQPSSGSEEYVGSPSRPMLELKALVLYCWAKEDGAKESAKEKE